MLSSQAGNRRIAVRQARSALNRPRSAGERCPLLRVKIDRGTRTTSLYNAADELTLVRSSTGQPTTITWDANGNQLLEKAGGTLTTHTWDDENRLLTTASGGSIQTNTDGADGKRRRKVVGAENIVFVWDGANVLLETDASLLLEVRYTDFPGYWSGLVSQRRGGTSSFYGFDLQWSTRVLVSISGSITDSYAFGAFGDELPFSGTTMNSSRYLGQMGYYRDLGERLYVRARRLSVPFGRWMTTDPVGGWHEDWNPYRYATSMIQLRHLHPEGHSATKSGRAVYTT